jgi:hypothetical protein
MKTEHNELDRTSDRMLRLAGDHRDRYGRRSKLCERDSHRALVKLVVDDVAIRVDIAPDNVTDGTSCDKLGDVLSAQVAAVD